MVVCFVDGKVYQLKIFELDYVIIVQVDVLKNGVINEILVMKMMLFGVFFIVKVIELFLGKVYFEQLLCKGVIKVVLVMQWQVDQWLVSYEILLVGFDVFVGVVVKCVDLCVWLDEQKLGGCLLQQQI